MKSSDRGKSHPLPKTGTGGDPTAKAAIVTGGARGIGKAVAKLLSERGMRVVICSRNEKELNETARELNGKGGERVFPFACDVSREEDVKSLFRYALDTFGRLDALVNCAAVIEPKPLEETDLASWNRVIGVNLTGPFLCCREAFRVMDPKRGGAIVNVSSLAGVPGVAKFHGFGSYTSSKFGLAGLTEILALEGIPKRIRVNTISPGAVDTYMLNQVAPDIHPKLTPEEVARVIGFLVSDDASVVTGTNTEVLSSHKPR